MISAGTRVLLSAMACLAMSLWASAEKKIVTLTSLDGKVIQAELLEKGKDKVKVRMGRKIYTLPFTKLTKASVELVRKAEVPTICDFKVEADFTKERDEVSRDRREPYTDSEGVTQYRIISDSYRIDAITGKVKVENRDVKDASPAAKLFIVVLCRTESGPTVIRREVFDLEAIEPLSDVEFPVGEAKTWHTERGRPLSKPAGLVAGRYSGYIAAVVIDGRIAEIASIPDKYERDWDSALEFLDLQVRAKKKPKDGAR